MLSQEYLTAPMPFLVGLHAPSIFFSELQTSGLESEMEVVVIFNLDQGTVQVRFSACLSRVVGFETAHHHAQSPSSPHRMRRSLPAPCTDAWSACDCVC